MPVSKHVQLVPCIPFRLLLSFRGAGLVSRCELDINLHILRRGKPGTICQETFREGRTARRVT